MRQTVGKKKRGGPPKRLKKKKKKERAKMRGRWERGSGGGQELGIKAKNVQLSVRGCYWGGDAKKKCSFFGKNSKTVRGQHGGDVKT